jgi:hypothetical protein
LSASVEQDIKKCGLDIFIETLFTCLIKKLNMILEDLLEIDQM